MKSSFMPSVYATIVITLAITNCGVPASTHIASIHNPIVVDRIIDENDLTPVLQNGENIPEKYRPLINAFGMIMPMACSATHIGSGLVLTAGHCFKAPEIRTNNIPCPTITVRWGLQSDTPEYLTSNCTQILAYEVNDNFDYAIFTVDPIPSSAILVELNERPSTNTPITIFSYPSRRPLEWSKTCTIQPAVLGNWGINMFSHQCDTEFGSSGSTILDDNSLKVVGIHGGGFVPWNYGTYLIDTPLKEYLF